MTPPAVQRAMLAGILVGSLASAWGAIYPSNTWLQVGPVLAGLPLAWLALRRWPIGNAAAGCIAAFVALHLVAACWSYSYTPYGKWLAALGLPDIDRACGFHRNMFDRLVHLGFGLLMVPAVGEIAARHAGLTRRMALGVAVLFVMAVSCLYEIFEWSLTLSMSAVDAAAYNGEQGDLFDSQKDMACAVVGAVLALPIARRHLSRLGR